MYVRLLASMFRINVPLRQVYNLHSAKFPNSLRGDVALLPPLDSLRPCPLLRETIRPLI